MTKTEITIAWFCATLLLCGYAATQAVNKWPITSAQQDAYEQASFTWIQTVGPLYALATLAYIAWIALQYVCVAVLVILGCGIVLRNVAPKKPTTDSILKTGTVNQSGDLGDWELPK